MHNWTITNHIVVEAPTFAPRELTVGSKLTVGTFFPRLPLRFSYSNVELTLSRSVNPAPTPEVLDPREWLLLVAELQAESREEALEKGLVGIEWATDILAFLVHIPILILQNSVRSDNPEDNRTFIGAMLDIPKFRSSITPGIVPGLPLLSGRSDDFGETGSAALRWYHKALAATFDIDRFIFAWIAVEFLAEDFSKKKPAELRPVVLRCGHEIDKCPTCSTETAYQRSLSGEKTQSYLNEVIGLNPELVKELYKFRHLVHGANKLTVEKTKYMDRLTLAIVEAAQRGLKSRLHIKENDPPRFQNKMIVRGMAMGVAPSPENTIGPNVDSTT